VASKFFKQIKITGLIIFIPLILAAWPLAGFFLADFFQKKFNLSPIVDLFGSGFGFVMAGREITMIIRLAIHMNEEE